MPHHYLTDLYFKVCSRLILSLFINLCYPYLLYTLSFLNKGAEPAGCRMEYPVFLPGQHMACGLLRKQWNEAQIFSAPDLKAASYANHIPKASLRQQGGVIQKVVSSKHI